MIRAMAYCGPASDSSPKPDRFKKPPRGKNVRTLVSLPPIVVPLENQATSVFLAQEWAARQWSVNWLLPRSPPPLPSKLSCAVSVFQECGKYPDLNFSYTKLFK